MNVPIQPELFAQSAVRKKCQEAPLYLKKRNQHRLGAGRVDPRRSWPTLSFLAKYYDTYDTHSVGSGGGPEQPSSNAAA